MGQSSKLLKRERQARIILWIFSTITILDAIAYLLVCYQYDTPDKIEPVQLVYFT